MGGLRTPTAVRLERENGKERSGRSRHRRNQGSRGNIDGIAGGSANEVHVAIEGHAVVISGEKKTESEKKDKAWHVVERGYGSFRRVVPLTLTPDASKIKASFDKGVLHVSVAKPEELVAKRVSIPIKKAG